MFQKTLSLLVIPLVFIFSSCGNSDEEEVKLSEEKTDLSEGKLVEKIADANYWDKSWSKDNTIIYHVLGDAGDLHPTNSLSAIRQEMALYTQVFLMNSDLPNSGLIPQLAAEAPQVAADGLEYTYTLVDYMKWDDGTPITAEDVIFTFKVNKCPLVNNPHAKPYLEMIKDVMIVSPNKIKVMMKEKYIQNIAMMTDYCILQRSYFDKTDLLSKFSFAEFNDPNSKCVNDEALKAWAAEFNDSKYGHQIDKIVGAGPYSVESWEPGQTITLTHKKNHWSSGRTKLYELAYPEKIIFKVNSDPNSSKFDFLNQKLDVSTALDINVLMELQKDKGFNNNYNFRFMNTYNYTFVGMNMRPDGVKHKKIFDDLKVRRAMAFAVPYESINTIVNKGVYERIVGPVSPLKPEYNTDLKIINTDLEKAKKLLSEAGWKDSDGDNVLDKLIDGKKQKLEFKFTYLATTPAWETTAKLICENLTKLQIKTELEMLTLPVFIEKIHGHDFDMMVMPMSGSTVPDDFKQTFHSDSWKNEGSNFYGFGTEESDKLIEDIRITLDDSARIKMVKKLQQLIVDEQPCVFMFAQKRRVIVHKRFGNQEYYYEKPGILLNRLKLLDQKSK